MSLEPRPLVPPDYPAVARVRSAAWPSHPATAADLERSDAAQPPGRTVRRLVLELGGEVVAEGSLAPLGGGRAWLEVSVRPDREGLGFGGRLYAGLERAAGSLGLERLGAFARGDRPRAARFAYERGFREVMRSVHQRLDLARFDPASFEGLGARVAAEGYRILSYPDLANDPEREARMYDLYRATTVDIPATGPVELLTPEAFGAQAESSLFIPEARLVALRGEEWAGYTATRRRAGDRPLEWHTGMTGVRREHRGRGLATALKLRAIELARAEGALELHSNNAATNLPMLAVNARLGFEREAAQLELEKVLKRDG